MGTRVGPFFKWFGSKWQIGKHYPNPKYLRIIEPFAGSAGYSCNHSDFKVILHDEDLNVRSLWRWLIYEASGTAIREIPINLPEGTPIRQLGLSFGQSLLLKHWQRTNNVGNCWTISPWGNKPGQWTANTRARLAEEIYAIKHWEIKDFITYIDAPSTWFLDPPYQYNYRYSKELPEFSYQSLDSLTQTINPKSQVIACEALGPNGEMPIYLPFKPFRLAVTSRRKANQSHHSRELIYIR